ncbi:MAG: PQQ-binding-like beta-propeller repeat protein [Spirochaetota bacterium]
MKRTYFVCFVMISMLSAGLFIQCSSTSKITTENTATVTMVIGDVQLKDDNVWKPLEQDAVLKQGQELKTGEMSQCNILVGDSSYILVKENSRLLLDSLFKSAIGIEQSTVELKIGKSIIHPKKLLKGEEFRVKTPTAIAAVRGTRFIIESHPDKKMRVAVIDGKVELQKRVPALEEADNETLEKSEELSSFKKQVESEKVILTANESAEIDNKKAAEVNEAVAAALEEFKKLSIEEEKVSSEMEKTESETAKDKITADIKKVNTRVSMQKLVRKSEGVKIDINEVKDTEKAEVNDFEQVIEKGDAIIEEKQDNATSLTILTPVKRSAIILNSKLLGYGSVKINPRPDVPLTIKVVARGFDDYTTEITLDDGEKKEITIPMTRKKLLRRERWKQNVGSMVSGHIGYYQNMVFTGTEKGILYAFSRDGKMLWKRSLHRKIESTPAFSGNSLYIVAHDEKLYSIDTRNGTIQWQKPVFGSLLFGAKPVVVENTILLVTAYGRVYAFSKKGEELWQNDLDAGVYSSPTVSGEKLYIGTDDHSVYCLDVSNGKIQWKFSTDSRIVTSSPEVKKGTVYVGAYSGSLYAIDADRGEQKWIFKADTSIMASPVIYNEKVYVTSMAGVLFALDENNGEVKWKYNSGKSISFSTVVANNLVYMASGNKVSAVNAVSGSLQWSHVLPSDIKTIPTVSGNDVFVGCENGELISLRASIQDVVQ